MIRVLAESGRTQFQVHKDILSLHSEPFAAATTGPWIEGSERAIDLGEWDSKTVGRMVEWLYTGDYKYPDPTPLGGSATATATRSYPIMVSSNAAAEPLDPTRPLTPTYRVLYPAAVPSSLSPAPMALIQFPPSTHDFEDAALAHGQLYALAHYKCIATLRKLAHYRLAATLAHMQPSGIGAAPAVASLARYIYANTDSLSNSEEPARRLVSHYIVSGFTTFQTHPAITTLINEGGDCAVDIASKLGRLLRQTVQACHFVCDIKVYIPCPKLKGFNSGRLSPATVTPIVHWTASRMSAAATPTSMRVFQTGLSPVCPCTYSLTK